MNTSKITAENKLASAKGWKSLPVITADLRYLYHATGINNEDSQEYMNELLDCGIPLPPFGQFSTDIKRPKFFTITPHFSYCMEKNYVLLRYSTIHPLRLVDVRGSMFDMRSEVVPHAERKDWDNLYSWIDEQKLDGYIAQEDSVEIYLSKPSLNIYPEYEQLATYPHNNEALLTSKYCVDVNIECDRLLKSTVVNRQRPAKCINLGVSTKPVTTKNFVPTQ